MKILILDPETNRQRQLRSILTSMGQKSADIEVATDGKSAISTLKKKKFDCVFMVLATNFDGISFLEESKQSGSGSTIPLVAFGPEVNRDNVMKLRELGVKGILAYPFTVSDVEVVLKTLSK